MKELIELAESKGAFTSEYDGSIVMRNEYMSDYIFMCLLQKWLRDEYDIDIWTVPSLKGQYLTTVRLDNRGGTSTHYGYDYEQALQQGLTKALELVS